MLNRFSTKELIFAALMGSLMFVLSFAFGSVLNIALGNPAASGLVSTLVQSTILTVAVLITKRFGIGTMMYLVYGVLAIPTNMLGAMPAPFKIALALSIGIIFDLVVFSGKYKKWSLFVGFVVMYAVLVPATLYIYLTLGLPNAEVLLKSAPVLFAVFLFESFIGVFIGLYIYKKIKDKNFVRQFQN